MYDYQIICFNGANRTKDSETTDAMAVHPISQECEDFITDYCEKNNITCIGGVAFVKGLNPDLTDTLYNNGFKESWTCFTDEYDMRVTNKSWNIKPQTWQSPQIA